MSQYTPMAYTWQVGFGVDLGKNLPNAQAKLRGLTIFCRAAVSFSLLLASFFIKALEIAQ